MSRPKKGDYKPPSVHMSDEEDGKQWLVTYADMVTLLMTFFVMLMALSSIDSKRFDNILQSIQLTMGAEQLGLGKSGGVGKSSSKRLKIADLTGQHEEPLLQNVRSNLNKKDLSDSVTVTREGNRILIRVGGKAMFKPGEVRINKGATPIIQEVVKIMRNHPEYMLDIKGHTDNQPIHTKKLDSNWELSALRATSVLKALVRRGIPARRVTATGYADTAPLVPNTSKANRAKNRRVEFVLEKESN